MELIKKKIDTSDPAFVQLKKAREALGISIATLADRLKMNKEHIRAIESGHFDQLPFAGIYRKKLIGNYAELVGLQKALLTKQFEMEQGEASSPLPFHHRRSRSWWQNLPFIFRVSGLSAMALMVIGYLGFQVKQIVNPPLLELFAPIDGVIAKTQTVAVKGKTDKEVKVTINGKEVTHDEQGGFEEPITLTQGVNTIIISATSKHGKSTTLTRYVVAQKDHQFSLSDTTQIHN